MSKGLDALNYLRECIGKKYYKEELDIIEQELKAWEIVKKYNNFDFRYLKIMVKCWEQDNQKITKELLEFHHFPFEVEEYEILKRLI